MDIFRSKPRGSSRKRASTFSLCLLVLLLAVPALPPRAYAADSNGENGIANPEENGAAENELKKAVENQLALLKDEPNNPGILRGLAFLYIQDGDHRNADRIFTRLLALNLDDPAAALPYAFGKWHVRQEYEAQAAMIRMLGTEDLSPGNVKLLKAALDEIYDPASMTSALKPEFPKPEELLALANLDTHFNEALTRIRALEAGGDAAGLDSYTAGLFGGDLEIRAFFTLWLCFSRIHSGDLDAAEAILTLAAPAIDADGVKLDAATASALLKEIRRGPLSSDMLNTLSELFSDVSSTVGGQLSESYVSPGELFDQARQLTRDGKFTEAAAVLASVRPRLSDNSGRARYIYYHADILWGREEYPRANQAYVASSVLQKERYALSSILYRMAEYAAMLHKLEDAATYAIRSAGYLRDQAWKLRQVGSFLIGLDMIERGIAYLERSLDASESLASDAESYAALAVAYRRIGDRDRYLDYAESYVKTIDLIIENQNDVNDTQYGLRYYFEGELLASEEKYAEAYQAFERASEYVVERFRLSEILMAMADYQANGGHYDKAEELAVRAGDLIPEQAWKARQVGNLLLRVGKHAKAVHYFERALEHSFSVQDRALSFSALTDVYRSLGEMERGFFYAREYIALVRMHRDQLTDQEEGLAAFYQGEIHAYFGERELAYAEYERAADLLENRFRRAENYMRMADYKMSVGAREEGAELAERSAEEIPDQGWKLQQVGNFFLRYGMPEKAMEYFRRFVRMTSADENLGVYAIMADAYKAMNRPEQYIQAASEYIAAAVAGGRVPTDPEKGLAAYYQAEIHRLRDEKDQAYDAYRQASELVDDPIRLFGILMEMARRKAELGDREEAAALAMRAVEVRPEAGSYQLVGDFLLQQGMTDEAFAYFERYAGDTADKRGRAGVYGTMAEAYKKLGDRKNYLLFAREYVATTTAEGYAAARDERGTAAYYRGEIAEDAGDMDAAFAAFEEASGLVNEKFRLADIYWRMAMISLRRGEREKAVELAERSAAILPHEAWKLKQISDFLLSLDMPERALGYIERYVGEAPGAETDKLSAYAVWAEARKRAGDQQQYLYFAGEFVKALEADPGPHSPADQGLAAYYRGELQMSRDEGERAYLSYEKAAELIEDKARLADIFLKMAEIRAGKGDTEEAAALAEKSADVSSDPAAIQRAGDFLLKLDRQDQAFDLYLRSAELASSPAAALDAYYKMAETARRIRDFGKYRRYAGEYAALVRAGGDFTRDQHGLAAYYRAEVKYFAGELDDSYPLYAAALELADNDFRRAEILIKMADIEATRGNRESAAELTERFLSLYPDDAWRIGQAVDMFIRLDMPQRAIQLLERRLKLADTARGRAGVYSQLAEVYRKLGDEDNFLLYAGEYVAVVSTADFDPTAAENALLYYYRAERHRATKNYAEAIASYKEAAALFGDSKYRLAETLMKIAELEAVRGDYPAAAEYAGKSLDVLPDEAWKVRQAAEMFIRIGMPEKAFEAYDRYLLRLPSPKDRAEVRLMIAETHRRLGDDDKFAESVGEYMALLQPEYDSLSPEEKGRFHYYRGEYNRVRNLPEEALEAYREASGLITDNILLAETFMKMATIESGMGNAESAADLAERSAELLPDDHPMLRRIAAFLLRLGFRDRAAAILGRRLSNAVTPAEKAAAYADLADFHKEAGDAEAFIRFAEEYAALVASGTWVPGPDELARRHIFLGDVHYARGELEAALEEYGNAVLTLEDGQRAAAVLMTMAGVEIERGDNLAADALIEQAVSRAPDDGRLLMEAASMSIRIGRPERAMHYYERRLAMAASPADKAYVLMTIAEANRRQKNQDEYIRYARRYVELTSAPGFFPTGDMAAYRHFFQGGVFMSENRFSDAVEELDQALRLFSDRYRKYETLMLLAEASAKGGKIDQAVRYAEEAADAVHDQAWPQRVVGLFFANLEMTEKAIFYYRRYLEMATNDKERASAYATLAWAYKQMGDADGFAEYARRYMDMVVKLGGEATKNERGIAAYFLGELYSAENRPYEAYRAYEIAAGYLDEPYRLAEIYAKLARHNVTEKNYDLAATQALTAATLADGEYWRTREIANILIDAKHYDDAIRVIESAVETKPRANGELYQLLSTAFMRNGLRRQGIKAHELYVEHLIRELEYGEPGTYRDQTLKLWRARQNHADLTTPIPYMGLDSDFYMIDFTNDKDFYRGMRHELYHYYYVNRYLKGKVYMAVSGTVNASYHGTYFDSRGNRREWNSRPGWGDTSRVVFGVSVNPFTHPLLTALSFKAEYILGTGRNVDDDVRFRITYDRFSDTRPRPFDCVWPYWKIYSDTRYSTRGSDVTSDGHLRRGLSLVSPWDRNFIINPYAGAMYYYDGKTVEPDVRWGADAGLGVVFKKYIGETRHRAPRESIEFDVFYRWGLTKDRNDGFGVTISTKF